MDESGQLWARHQRCLQNPDEICYSSMGVCEHCYNLANRPKNLVLCAGTFARLLCFISSRRRLLMVFDGF